MMSAKFRNTVGAFALSLVSLVVAGGSTSHAEAAPTIYAFGASGFGTEVIGGAVPLHSGRTVLSVLSCTVQAPRGESNRAAAVDLGALPVVAKEVKTSQRSMAINGGYASVSKTTVEDLQVGSGLSKLRIRGLVVRSIGSYRNGNPDPSTYGSFADAKLFIAGVPRDISLSELRDGVTVPGVATVVLLGGATYQSNVHNAAKTSGVRIELHGTQSKVLIARAYARIDKIPHNGPIGGTAKVARAVLNGGTAVSGPLMYLPQPCRGTDGDWESESLAVGRLSGVGTARNSTVRVKSDHVSSDHSYARTVSDVGQVSLDNGRIRLEAIRANANVVRQDGVLSSSAGGTRIGQIFVDGEQLEVPDLGETLTVPGVVKISFGIIRRFETGIDVTAAKVELLDGSENVLIVARSSARIG